MKGFQRTQGICKDKIYAIYQTVRIEAMCIRCTMTDHEIQRGAKRHSKCASLKADSMLSNDIKQAARIADPPLLFYFRRAGTFESILHAQEKCCGYGIMITV